MVDHPFKAFTIVQPSSNWAFFLLSLCRERTRSLKSHKARSSGKPAGCLHVLLLCSARGRSKPIARRGKVGDLTAGGSVGIKGLRKPGCLLKTSDKEVKSIVHTYFAPDSKPVG